MSFTTTGIPSSIIIDTTSAPDIIPVNAYKSDPELDAAVKYATESCKPDITDPEKLAKALSQGTNSAADAMNIQACKSDTTTTEIKGGGASLFGAFGFGGKGTSTSQTGCEQINISSAIVNQCSQQLSCMLNQADSSTTTNVRVYQKINAEFLGNISGNVNLANISEAKVQTFNLTQSTVQSAIGATITAGIQDVLSQLATTNNEALSDPTAQKNYNTSLANLQQVASNSTINQSVARTTNNLVVDQTINLKIWKDVTGEVSVTNQNMVSLISENYVYNALDQLFKTDAGVEFKRQVEQASAQQNKGISTSVDLSDFTKPFSDLVKGATSVVGKAVGATAAVYIVAIVGIVVVLGSAMFFGPRILRYLTPWGMFGGGDNKVKVRSKKQKQQKPATNP